MIRVRIPRLVAGVLAVSLSLSLSVAGAGAAHAESYVPISGTGSTWSQNALDQWRKNVASNYGMTVNFSGTGSSAGRADFINGTVDFAISEIPFQLQGEGGAAGEDPSGRPYAYLPIVAGGTSLMYNLKIGGKRVTNLQLSGAVISKIFTGQITKWNDAAIAADNPALTLPDRNITPVYRSDGSGTSAQFTLWMSKQHPDIWTQGQRSQFPPANATFKGQSGSLGVAGYVSQDYGEGSITYVEYSYALKNGFPVARVLNAAGQYVEPTASNVEVALREAKVNTDQSSADYLTQILDGVYNNGDPAAYPISSYSYMIVPTTFSGVFQGDAKGYTLGQFVKYVVCDGQNQAGALGYSPLPMNLVRAAFDQIKRIPASGIGDFNEQSCKNAGAAAGENPSSSGDDGGQQQQAGGGAAATGDGAAAASGADAAAAAGAEAVYDANGNLVSGSAASAGGASAVSSPFTLASNGWGTPQWIMLVAGVLLLLAVILPPILMSNARRNSGSSS